MFPLTISPPCFDLTLRLSVSQCTFSKKRRFYRKYIQNKSYKQSLLHELNLHRSAHLIRKYISYSVQKESTFVINLSQTVENSAGFVRARASKLSSVLSYTIAQRISPSGQKMRCYPRFGCNRLFVTLSSRSKACITAHISSCLRAVLLNRLQK